jgi:UDP-N-acetylmuramate: L-alanyl-gamma-D-glutamyl-meso-diaminopimelate ligase
MRVHFIAIGGSAMHSLALALQRRGDKVTGSDDAIFEPSKSRLADAGLLPDRMGWDANRVTADIDGVVLGMHARENNPELIKAQSLGIQIWSYPEFLYQVTQDKTRVVIGGSHGKTTTTAMLLHVLNHCEVSCDYMVPVSAYYKSNPALDQGSLTMSTAVEQP